MEHFSKFSTPEIPKFDGLYDHYSMLIETTPDTPEQHQHLEEIKLKDIKAKSYSFQETDHTILEIIHVCNTKKIGIPCEESIMVI